MNSKQTLNKVKTLLGLEVQLEERKLENGTRFEADAFEKGKEVFIITDEDERIAVPAGSYLLDDGFTLIVKEDGIIDEVKEAVEEEVEETVEAPVVEEVEAAEEADVQDWEGMEKRIKNLEDAIADLKVDKENKVEASEIEVEAEVELSAEETAKPFKHNPEAKAKTETNLFAQNRAQTTKDRVFNKLFNNN
jgi:dGTP triphosphohydrolase